MTRECTSDFKSMKSYVENYEISKNLLEHEYVASLKSMHKCYFSAITWNAEILNMKDQYLNYYPNVNDEIIFRLNEVTSDLGSSMFNWINGNYKASRVMLRVAIENFVRAISALEEKNQLTEKNVYRLFRQASIQKIFNDNQLIKICYESLHSDYKLLCQDTHTASIQNMEHLTSLADLPSFNRQKSSGCAEVYVRTSKNISAIFCLLFNIFFHKMHHRNKENILHCLDHAIKSGIHEERPISG